MTNESVSLAGVEEKLWRVVNTGWDVDALNIDFNLFVDDLEKIRRDPRGYGIAPKEFGLESFDGQNIEDFLDPAWFIEAHCYVMGDDDTRALVLMRVELLPGGSIKQCLVSEAIRRA